VNLERCNVYDCGTVTVTECADPDGSERDIRGRHAHQTGQELRPPVLRLYEVSVAPNLRYQQIA